MNDKFCDDDRIGSDVQTLEIWHGSWNFLGTTTCYVLDVIFDIFFSIGKKNYSVNLTKRIRSPEDNEIYTSR
jgi:hypothetical protein